MRDYSKVVLIVDDNRLIRNALRSFLELKAKMEVCGEATDGIEALEKARKLRPNLILMDLSMPNLNGLDAAIAIKRAVPEARIVVFTLFADTVGGVIAKTLGVDLVVSKTEGADGLLRALQPLLAKDDSSLLH